METDLNQVHTIHCSWLSCIHFNHWKIRTRYNRLFTAQQETIPHVKGTSAMRQWAGDFQKLVSKNFHYNLLLDHIWWYYVCVFVVFFCFFFFQAEDGIRDRFTWLEFRRVLFRSEKSRVIIKNGSTRYNLKKYQHHKEAMWVDKQPTPSPPGARVATKTSFPRRLFSRKLLVRPSSHDPERKQ